MRIRPSYQAKPPPRSPRNINIMLMAIKKGISIYRELFSTGSFVMSEDMPSISSMLIILLPSTLPIITCVPDTSPIEALMPPMIETAASGAEVPSATTVKPIINVDTCSFSAMPEAPSTKKSAPFTSKTNPTNNRTIHKNAIQNNPYYSLLLKNRKKTSNLNYFKLKVLLP